MSAVVPESSTLDWAKVDLTACPSISVPPPGPKSNEYHQRCTRYFKGLSGQVKLFPVAFESGEGCVLTDVDGNRYIDFSSGIYVTTLGHCHPKISEAVAKYARQLMNAHDFTTPVKTMLVEKLAGTCLAPRAGGPKTDGSNEGRAHNHRRRSREGMSDGNRTGGRPNHQGPVE